MTRSLPTILLVILLVPAALRADAGVVSHVKIVSNRVEDVSSLEAWKRSFIKPGMSDKAKALAAWETVVKFRHQDVPPNEFLQHEAHPHDPIKSFNVYGYGQCCCASANVQALARHAGLQSRGWAIVAHSVPEVHYDNQWHMLDASLVTHFPDAKGNLVGVEALTKGVSEWLAKHPELKNNDAALRQFMTRGGWRKGPDVLSRSPFYDDNGWLPAATHGWYATVQEYADPSKTHVYEYGSAVGYQVNVQLRKGERLARNWSNKGFHVNKEDGGGPGCMTGVPGKDDLRYATKFGDLAPGRVGNGEHAYDVPLDAEEFQRAAIEFENLSGSPLRVTDPEKPATIVLRMPSSYVYLAGEMNLKTEVPEGGHVSVLFSDNNGLDWRDIASYDASIADRIDLKELVLRRYDYRIKFVLRGAGTGLDRLSVRHDVQHSQRALPALDRGDNRIAFSAGPHEGTITIEGSTSLEHKSKNLLYADFHPTKEGMRDSPFFIRESKGFVSFPVQTPGEMKRLRIGAHYRARDKTDGWDVEVSFDGGKTFKTIDRLAGPTPGNSRYIVFGDVPRGTTSAVVRFSGTQRNATGLFDLRIDADYAESHGGAAPVKVTYVWTENGVEKRDVRTVARASETYSIRCEKKPVMKSVTVERE